MSTTCTCQARYRPDSETCWPMCSDPQDMGHSETSSWCSRDQPGIGHTTPGLICSGRFPARTLHRTLPVRRKLVTGLWYKTLFPYRINRKFSIIPSDFRKLRGFFPAGDPNSLRSVNTGLFNHVHSTVLGDTPLKNQ